MDLEELYANIPPSSNHDVSSSNPASETHPRPVRAHKVPSYLKDYVLCSPTTESQCLPTTTNFSL